uniref:Golgin B1 n=1 Tax=Esox lucius TaxID=8010 RepID=A0AAY5KLG2_ESOLU
MFSRLSQGLNNVLQELSGDEPPDGDPQQDMLVPQLPPGEPPGASEEYGSRAEEDTLERLAHLEQLTVQLKEVVRVKDSQLATLETQLKSEKETAEARFTKLKLQAKAKMASLTKQIADLKGQEGAASSPDSSFTSSVSVVEEELQELKRKLREAESSATILEERLQMSEKVLHEKEAAHTEQVRVLQAVVWEKDVRFQEQIQQHEEELLRVTGQIQNDIELQQALRVAQRRCEEQEEAMRSRSQVLEMLQEELNNADQQKQILTAQFRQMEEQLADASRQREVDRQQWTERSSQAEAELVTLQANLEASERDRAGLTTSLEASERDRVALTASLEVSERDRVALTASLEASERDTVALTASLEASERDRVALTASLEVSERDRVALTASLEVSERDRVALTASLEASERDRVALTASLEASERDRDAQMEELTAKLELATTEWEKVASQEEVARLEKELTLIREEHGESQRTGKALAELLTGLRSLLDEGTEEDPVPTDPALCLATLQAHLERLKVEQSVSEERCVQVTQVMETLQEQLDRSTSEGNKAVARIQQLEQQIGMADGESLAQHANNPSVEGVCDSEKDRILALEQLLLEKDNELASLRERFALAEEQSCNDSSNIGTDPNVDQSEETAIAASECPLVLPDLLEDTREEDTTLVGEDSSILSISADNESSPELVQPQSDSTEESKGASSDEMVTSSDSEVAHSSWTLLEALNQDEGQQWPSVVQDFGQIQLQSWEENGSETVTSTVQVESSSVIISETVQVHLSQQGSAHFDSDSTTGNVFPQAQADDLDMRYGELMAELLSLRKAASESQEKTQRLEEDIRILAAAKDEAESRAQTYEEELQSARSEIYTEAQHSGFEVERQSREMRLLEEQLASLQTESSSKEQKIQALQADLEQAKHCLSEQEGQARMLSAQLEDREMNSSELEQKLQDMEASLLEFSKDKDIDKALLSERDTEISKLQQFITLKEQEMMELSEGMSAKLVQASEEKFLVSTEVQKLKEKIFVLEKAGEKEDIIGERNVEEAEELTSLRKDKEDLTNQVAAIKKRLQAALLQRKELMKKVAEFEKGADQTKEKEGNMTAEDSASVLDLEKERKQEVLSSEIIPEDFRHILRSKEEAMEVLEHKISQQDQLLAETLAINRRLTEVAEQTVEADTSNELARLQSHVSSLESDCETLQKKLQDAQDFRKDTIRKAKEKDRHYREQLKQQKEEYNGLLERLNEQAGERDGLVNRLRELEELQTQKDDRVEKKEHAELETKAGEKLEKPAAGDWVQEDWVDFATSENEAQQQSDEPIPCVEGPSRLISAEMEASLHALKDEVQAWKSSCTELERQLQDCQDTLSFKESKLLEQAKELQALREKESQIDHVYEELEALKEKCLQAQTYAETVKAEMEVTAKGASTDSAESSIAVLQAEVDEFKQFLTNKNNEIMELSQQLSEQSSLLQSMQETVSEKDHLIASLQAGLKVEQEKSQRLEAEVPHRQEEEKDSEAKIMQLQQKLKAALISRKEALKENKSQKEDLASSKQVITELQQKMESREVELEKLRAEREKLIEEVDRTLVENQGLGASCESLKLAMEGMQTEKEFYKREAETAKEEAVQACRELEEKMQGMRDEYETLLKSYENVSDEAERVRRVLEAARQERKELAAKVRTHQAACQEAERQKEEAQKEVDTVKDKMRKFAKTKQQKIMDLEEENERLREMEENKGTGNEDKALKRELDRFKEQLEAIKDDLKSTTAQRDSLEEQALKLREQLAQQLENREQLASVTTPSSHVVVEETIIAQQSSAGITETTQEPVASCSLNVELHTQAMESEVAPHEKPSVKETMGTEMTALLEEKLRETEAALQSERELRQEHEAELTAELASLEQRLQESKEREQSLREELVKPEMPQSEQVLISEKLREMEESLKLEREQWQVCEAELKAGIAALELRLQESTENEQSLIVESSKKEAQLKMLHSRLEAEKDDLEERLMNQLAQLNGSIAGYQQDAADSRERLTELQREVERLHKEQAELEALVKSEKDQAARLEEDKRQAQRERAEAEAESGKHRELEQQLKSAQRVKEGSQSRAKQLEELLREKQLEVRQMQKDCIQYQERISEMAREGKALQLSSDELHKELGRASLERDKVTEALKNTEAELSSFKAQLVEAQRDASQAQAEKRAFEQAALQRESELKLEAEQTLDSVRCRLGAELKQIELRLEESYREREREEDATREAKEMADTAKRQNQQMQSRLDESLARLAAFSRCMSSLQDDRDRVLDETRQWETRFNSTLQGKEAEVQEAETRARDLAEQLQKETAQREELQLTVDRLQKAEEQWQLKWEQFQKRSSENQAALEQERGELQKALAQAEGSLSKAHALLASLESEAEGLRHRAQVLEEAVEKLQGETSEARAELREREAMERRLALSVEQLETDLHSSKTLTESLQTELSEKERREVELLGEKEQAVTQAAEEARKEADASSRKAERELEERREEVRGLEDRLRKAEEGSSHNKAKLDAFTKAMGSLQDDRDHVLSMYKQLEEKHLQVMMDKDSLIQEAAGENNSLKEELRSLLIQRDDLHAEKAQLSAQLHGYRDHLTQVLTLKDSQHKQLLASHLERIASLEKEREKLATMVQRPEGPEAFALEVERESLSQAGDILSEQVKDAPGAEVEKLREQLQASRAQVESLEDSLAQERQAHEAQTKELRELRWEGGVTRTESETAAERVAELARDLLTMEQKLLEEREAAGQLRAQNQAFGQAMASLQDSRDQALSRVQELSLRLEEMSKAGGPQTATAGPGGSSSEVWGLKNALSALQNDRERLLEQMQRQQSELTRLGGGDVSRLSQELEEERRRAEEMRHRVNELEDLRQRENQELEMLRLEQIDWQTQAELLKQQTLATLSARDHEVRRLGAMLQEANTSRPKLLEEHYQRKAPLGTDLSSEVQVLHSKSESGPLNELQLREQEITGLRNQLSQVFEENQHLSSQFRGSCQRLDESESRCMVLQRQLRELHEDKSKVTGELDSAPGAPQQHSGPSESEGLMAEFKELQHRLDEEQQYRMLVEQQLMASQERFKRINQGDWQSAHKGHFTSSESAVLIEPPGGSVTRIRSSSGPGLARMLRVAFCSRQRTPLLVSLYLLTVHVLLLLCLGGYL